MFVGGCEPGEGGTTDFHLGAVRDRHASARTSEKFDRSESGSHEPDHQSAQSAAVPAQRRRGANFRSAHRVRASTDHRQTREIENKQRRRGEAVEKPACLTRETLAAKIGLNSKDFSSCPPENLRKSLHARSSSHCLDQRELES